MTALRFGMFALGLAACLTPVQGRAVDLGLAPYIEYNAGVSIIRNQNITRANPIGLSGRVESEPGFNVGGAIGTKFLQHFRTEINVGYRQSEVDAIRLVRGDESDGKGAISMIHLLGNVYAEYDFELGVIPYFGIGAGWGLIEIDARNTTRTIEIDAGDHAFIWNVMAGASVPFTDVTSFSLGYRYLQSEDLNFRARRIGPPVNAGRQVDSEFDSHEVVFGIRYSF